MNTDSKFIKDLKDIFNILIINLVSQNEFMIEDWGILNSERNLALIVYSEKICPNSRVCVIHTSDQKELHFAIKNDSFRLSRTFNFRVDGNNILFTISNTNKEIFFPKSDNISVSNNSLVNK